MNYVSAVSYGLFRLPDLPVTVRLISQDFVRYYFGKYVVQIWCRENSVPARYQPELDWPVSLSHNEDSKPL